MTGWLMLLASGGPVYVPSSTPSPAPTHPGLYISAPGLDISQVLGILIPLITVAIVVLTFRDARLTRKQEQSETDLRETISHFTDVLSERMETKENVAILRERVAGLRTEVSTLREVIRELNRTVEQLRGKRS